MLNTSGNHIFTALYPIVEILFNDLILCILVFMAYLLVGSFEYTSCLESYSVVSTTGECAWAAGAGRRISGVRRI
jgi:hypothetical protein